MKNFVILIILLFPLVSSAQTSEKSPWLKKGEIQVGVGIGTGFGGYSGNASRIAPFIQYFIRDRWAIRLEGQYDEYNRGRYPGDGFKRPQYFGLGLATQYHFLKTDRLSLYGQAGYSIGQYRADIPEYFDPNSYAVREVRANYNRFSLGLGAQYRLSDRWLISAQIERRETTRFKGGSFGVNVGVAFRIK